MSQESEYEIVNLQSTSTRGSHNNRDTMPRAKDLYASLGKVQKPENEYQVPNTTTKLPTDAFKNRRNKVLLAVAITALITSTLAIAVTLMGVGVYSGILEQSTAVLERQFEELEVKLNATQNLLNTPVNLFHKCRVDTISNSQRIELGDPTVYILETYTGFLPINITVSLNCDIH